MLEQQTKTPGSTNQPDWVFRVKDQINGASDDSRIVMAPRRVKPRTGFALASFRGR